jgi:GNAT superfamily N-acetyltransferase
MTLREISSEADVSRLTMVAKEVWREANTSFCSEEQVEYMIAKYQSFEAIMGQLINGYRYFVMEQDGDICAYMGVQPQGPALFLSKFYVLKPYRGAGLFSAGLEVLKQICRDNDMCSIYLTVNRHNTHAYEVYLHKGFTVIREEVNDIGFGIVMDDYIMELIVE